MTEPKARSPWVVRRQRRAGGDDGGARERELDGQGWESEPGAPDPERKGEGGSPFHVVTRNTILNLTTLLHRPHWRRSVCDGGVGLEVAGVGLELAGVSLALAVMCRRSFWRSWKGGRRSLVCSGAVQTRRVLALLGGEEGDRSVAAVTPSVLAPLGGEGGRPLAGSADSDEKGEPDRSVAAVTCRGGRLLGRSGVAWHPWKGSADTDERKGWRGGRSLDRSGGLVGDRAVCRCVALEVASYHKL